MTTTTNTLENTGGSIEDRPTEFNLSRAAVNEIIKSMDELDFSDNASITTPEFEVSRESLPEGFEDYDFDMLEGQARVSKSMEPLRQNASQRLGFSWIKGGGLYGNLSAFSTSLKESREARRNAKLMNMEVTKQREFLEKHEARQMRIRKIGLYALAGGMSSMALRPLLEPFVTSLMDNHEGVGELANSVNELNSRPDNRDVALMYNDGPMPRPNNINDTLLATYDNGDSSFFDYAHKDFRGDFGPMVKASPDDGIYGAGFADWMGRNKHEPNGLANLVSGLKLDGRGDSLTDRNALADIYDNDRGAHARADLMVQAELKNTDKFTLETIDIDFKYDTTYMVDMNGDPVIATQSNTDHGGTAFKITNKQTGEVTYWRKNCGAYQQIWPIKEAPYVAPKQVPVIREMTQVQEQPVKQTQPIRNVTPPVDRTPTPPSGGSTPPGGGGNTPPGGGDTPPPATEEEHKGDAYIKDEKAAVKGSYEFRAVPGQVSTEVRSQGQPGIDQDPITDKHTVTPQAETGGAGAAGSAPDLGSPGTSEGPSGGNDASSPGTGTASGPE